MKTSILLCVALMGVSSLAHADGGTIRFSGRIVDPGCSARVDAQQLRLEGCPLSAKGATVALVAMDEGQGAVLRDGKRQGQQLAVAARSLRAGDLVFSESYRLDAPTQQPLQGAYLVRVDYP